MPVYQESSKFPRFQLGLSGVLAAVTFVGGFLFHTFTIARNIPSVQDIAAVRLEQKAYVDTQITQALRSAEDRHQQIMSYIDQKSQGCLDHSDLNRKDAASSILLVAGDVKSNQTRVDMLSERIISLERECFSRLRSRYQASSANYLTELLLQGGS